MFSKLSSPEIGIKMTAHNTVRTPTNRVIDHALNIRVDRLRYVLGQTTSPGGEASRATSCMGSGSTRACTAICYHNLVGAASQITTHRLTAEAVESNVTKAKGIGLNTFLRVDVVLSLNFRSFSS